MEDFPLRITSVFSYSVALMVFVVTFIGARHAVHWLRKNNRKGS